MTAKTARGGRRRREAITAGLMLAPAFIGVVLFQYLPLADVLSTSLRRVDPFTRAPVGGPSLTNYSEILADPDFRRALLNTALYIAITICLEIPVALILAITVNQRLPGSRALRAAVIAAMAASETVGALVWSQMYESAFGILNSTLAALHLPQQPFLTSEHQALAAITVMSVWRGVGLPMLIFLGGLQLIPQEVYEAAKVDGVGPLRTLLQITVPLLKPSLVVAAFMSMLSGARIFTPISVMTDGGPNGSTGNLIYYSYQQAFSFQAFGPAAAAAVVMLLLLVVLSVAQARILRSE
ncbi:sugar ABC transporter permease [Actinomadura graeca]|uniref:Sugar ABC transporter permease n=1 Tax=Actinomadura graeca TaxID=2750812 RepID=A0ABX8QYT0_9ACTN|nr:sugar ABC transporter permease [Actinomadura graeca]QXJ23818.1 sugar ABC transporter permease [Actinomadura graeca]